MIGGGTWEGAHARHETTGVDHLLGGAAAWPLTAWAQSPAAPPRVGLLSIGAVPERPLVWEPFFDRMRELGHEDGQSVVYVRGFGAGRAELIETMVQR